MLTKRGSWVHIPGGALKIVTLAPYCKSLWIKVSDEYRCAFHHSTRYSFRNAALLIHTLSSRAAASETHDLLAFCRVRERCAQVLLCSFAWSIRRVLLLIRLAVLFLATGISNPKQPKDTAKTFTFDYSYWSHTSVSCAPLPRG